MKTFKTFLINDKKNKQGWRIPKEVLERTARDWINVPGILFRPCAKHENCNYEHTAGDNLQDAIKRSQENAVTVIRDVAWEGNNLVAYHEILDPDFIPVLCSKLFAVSPSVWNLTSTNNPVLSYVPLHLSFLDQSGAYRTAAEDIDKSICKLKS